MSTALDKGLPVSLDAERYVLGSIFLDGELFIPAAGAIVADDFSLEKHRRIWRVISALHERGEKIDRVTVTEELIRRNQLESCDGLSYLLSLEDGLPRTSNIDAYLRIVKEKANLRRVIFAAQKTVDQAMLAQDGSSEIASAALEQFLKLSVDASAGAQGPRNLQGYIQTLPGGINALLDPETRLKGTPTGYTALDELTGGLRPGELWIIAGRPRMGKSTICGNIAAHVVQRDEPRPVLLFSLEMSAESLWNRLICSEARVNLQKFRAGFLNERERRELMRAATKLAAAPLFIDDSPKCTIFDIHAKARRLKMERGLGLVGVDYLQLMTMPGKSENRVQEVSAISRGLKLSAKDLEVPIIALSQLSRAPEKRNDPRPGLADLRESGSLEQDSDVVAFVFRPEVYSPSRTDLRGQAELIIGKQRNGPEGIVKLVFIKDYTKFENPASNMPEEPDLYSAGEED